MSRDLSSLAILKVFYDRQGTVLEAFKPFVIDTIIKMDKEQVDIEPLKAEIYKNYQVDIPIKPLERLLNLVASKDRIIQRESGLYLFRRDKIADHDFAKASQKARREHGKLRADLIAFAGSKHGVQWDDPKAEEVLQSFVETYKIEILKGAHKGELWNLGEKRQKAIVAEFALSLQKQDDDGYNALVRLVEGYVLSQVVNSQDQVSSGRKFYGTTLYLDSNFLFSLLGFDSDVQQKAAEELVRYLKKLKATLCAFSDTISEMTDKLRSCRHALHNGFRNRENRMLLHMLRRGWTVVELDARTAGTVDALARHGIGIADRPAIDPSRQIDQAELEGVVVANRSTKYGFDPGDPNEQAAIRHDVNAISAIYQLRNPKERTEWIESSVAAFLTASPRLAKAAQIFHTKTFGFGLPPAVFDSWLITILWLKNPSQGTAIARLTLAADCYAALQPTPDMWHAYIRCLDQMRENKKISESDYELASRTREAECILSTSEVQEPKQVNPETVSELIARVKHDVAASDEARIQRAEAARDSAVNVIFDENERRVKSAERFARLAYRTTWAALSAVILLALITTCWEAKTAWIKGICFVGATLSVPVNYGLSLKGIGIERVAESVKSRARAWKLSKLGGLLTTKSE